MRIHKIVILGTILLIALMITAIFILLQKKPPTIIVLEQPPPPPLNHSNEYIQIGILTSSESDKEPIILPLFSRNVYGRSDRFQYYTVADKQHFIHLPIQFRNRECEERIGCEELYNGDKITVTSYENREFTVTIYKRC